MNFERTSIMEYLYLPTTTLNFNNILSTGSISPASYYSARQFGFKLFEAVEPNPFDNMLLLYDRFPEFAIKDNERDNYPLVIRLRSDSLPLNLVKHPRVKFNIYSCSETIYFDLSSTELLFASKNALHIALTKSKPSHTTKLVKLTQPHMRIYYPGEFDAFEWSREILSGLSDGENDMVIKICEADSRINRLKGFITGYIIGAYKSISPKMADGRSNFRAVRNFVSEILNDPNISKTMRKDLEYACTIFDAFFAEVGIGSRRFDPDNGDGIGIVSATVSYIRDHHKFGEGSLQFLIYLVNKFCLTSDFYGQLDEKRFDVAMAGAEAVRASIGDAWKGSAYQVYINALLNNIKSGTAFDFESSDCLTIQSFAAFILKGDDLEKLETFLTVHGICDFRITFALWGAMFGFSQIPENFYNLPFSQGADDYARKMHAYSHSLVHGVAPHDEPLWNRNKIIAKETSVEPISKAGELPIPIDNHALLDQLQKKYPGSTPWIPKLLELLLSSDGFNKNFIDKFKKTTVKSWPTAKKGTRKNDVLDFFNRELPTTFFGIKSELTFWNDPHVFDALRSTVPSGKINHIRVELDWFLREWKNPDSEWYGERNEKAKAKIAKMPLVQRSNIEAIIAFCSVLKTKKVLHDEDLEKLRGALMNKYI